MKTFEYNYVMNRSTTTVLLRFRRRIVVNRSNRYKTRCLLSNFTTLHTLPHPHVIPGHLISSFFLTKEGSDRYRTKESKITKFALLHTACVKDTVQITPYVTYIPMETLQLT